MKKSMALILGFVMVVVLSAPSFAFMRNDMSLVKGKVLAYDVKAATIKVEGERGEGKMIFDLKGAEVTTSIDKGHRVVVIYKNAGTKVKHHTGTKAEEVTIYHVTIVKPVPPGR